ncbi:MAG: FtsW/RodA/SpoVE family cell cycle protein [Oscillospiraceae bacterium]|nr:FtsW/RodA/SpoVE family cell cycle protein [Oscillospiraceae bacterium]
MTWSKYALIALSLVIMLRCIRSMLSSGFEAETWATARFGRDSVPVTHWENLIGRARSADIRIDREDVERIQAVLRRRDDGRWTIYDVFSRGGVSVNGEPVTADGAEVESGAAVKVGGATLRLQDLGAARGSALDAQRTSAGKSVSPALTLFELTLFQLLLLFQHLVTAAGVHSLSITLGFAVLLLLEWFCYYAMRLIGRSGFEIETIAFYLTGLGLSVTASSAPQDMFKQTVLILLSFVLFLLLGLWLRDLRRTARTRLLVAALAVALLALNLATSDSLNGAKSWLSVAGFSFQPSELVKVAYIYVGAATLDRLYRRRNLLLFIVFSALCVGALALIGDFGSALVFFICFLVISFLRSGSIATVFLAVSGAAMAGFLAVSIKPYIARRFATWGHVWEDVYGAGYQQTRALGAAAGGGLFGKGAGGGWLTEIVAADTDMVFAVICEEQGLIIALCMVLAVLTLSFFAVRTARRARSAYYAIAACAAVSMLMAQMALNVFGSLDLLPFTGVTFPFVSRGGTSLLACWMMMAFIKGADTRRGGSFVVRPVAELFSAAGAERKAAPKGAGRKKGGRGA